MSDAWLALAGTLGGVLLGGLMSLGTAALTNRRQVAERREDEALEESKRLREERRDAAITFLDACEASFQVMTFGWNRRLNEPDFDLFVWDDYRDAARQLQTAYVRLEITSRADVRNAAEECRDMIYAAGEASAKGSRDEYVAARGRGMTASEQLNVAVRSELGVED